MGIFRKKKEVKTVNRTVVIILEVLAALFLFTVLLAVKWAITSIDKDAGKTKLENQVVDNLSFVDFVIDKEGVLTVSAINYTEETLNFKSVKIRLYAKDNSLISQVEVPEELELEKNQEHLITADVGNIDKVYSVEYIVE